jgi:hypothetical protein
MCAEEASKSLLEPASRAPGQIEIGPKQLAARDADGIEATEETHPALPWRIVENAVLPFEELATELRCTTMYVKYLCCLTEPAFLQVRRTR